MEAQQEQRDEQGHQAATHAAGAARPSTSTSVSDGGAATGRDARRAPAASYGAMVRRAGGVWNGDHITLSHSALVRLSCEMHRSFQARCDRDLLRAAAAIEPHLDAIVCYASTQGEHEPNRLAANLRAAIAKATA